MPRRNRIPELTEDTHTLDLLDIGQLIDVTVPANKPVSVALAKQFYKMAKQIEYKLENCPVCLDELCCSNCFTLLPCSHYLCAPCYMRLVEKRCPVCRAE